MIKSSSGSGVHADRKYCLNAVFWQNNRFNRNKTVQFSRVSRPSCFYRMPNTFFKWKCHRSPLLPCFSGAGIVGFKTRILPKQPRIKGITVTAGLWSGIVTKVQVAGNGVGSKIGKNFSGPVENKNFLKKKCSGTFERRVKNCETITGTIQKLPATLTGISTPKKILQQRFQWSVYVSRQKYARDYL